MQYDLLLGRTNKTFHVDDCSISSALAIEILQSCSKQSNWYWITSLWFDACANCSIKDYSNNRLVIDLLTFTTNKHTKSGDDMIIHMEDDDTIVRFYHCRH